MPNNLFGQSISLSNSQTHSQIVIDTAVLVWTQMGLNAAQIEYGISMMNVESGYGPQQTNNLPGSIRGLGQTNSGTWDEGAVAFDTEFGLKSGDWGFQNHPTRLFTNAPYPKPKDPKLAANWVALPHPLWNPLDNYNTNGVAGESGDSTGGIYDPEGLVAQLEVNGELIQREWAQAQSPEALAAAQAYASGGMKNGNLLLGDSQEAISARAYMQHHQGSGWTQAGGRRIYNKDGSYKRTTDNLIAHNLKTFKDAPNDVPIALQRVVNGVIAEKAYAAANGGVSSFLVADPFALANSSPSANELGAGGVIMAHDIPSIIPTGGFLFSQTIGGLSSFTATLTGGGKSADKTPLVETYAFVTKGNLANAGSTNPWVVSGTATYNFSTHVGSGSELMNNGEILKYTVSEGLNSETLHQTYLAPDSSVSLESVTKTTRSGNLVQKSEVDTTHGAITGGELFFIDEAKQIQRDATYNSQGYLTEVHISSEQGASSIYHVGDNGITADQLAARFSVPVKDPEITGLPLHLRFDYDGNIVVNNDANGNQLTSEPDPGVSAEATDISGNRVSWSFSLDGFVQSRTVTAEDGSSSALQFDSSGQISGFVESVYQADGSVLNTTRSLQGDVLSLSVVQTIDDEVVLNITGSPVDYENGCTISTNYLLNGMGNPVPETVSIKTFNFLDGNRTKTVEQQYRVSLGPDGSATYTYAGETITTLDLNTSTSVSVDYDVNGIATASRSASTAADGTSSISVFDASGVKQGTTITKFDSSGLAIVQYFDASGVLDNQLVMGADGSLTKTSFAGGASVTTSYSEADDGDFEIDNSSNGSTTAKLTLNSGETGQVYKSADGSFVGSFTLSNDASRQVSGDAAGNVSASILDAHQGVVANITSTVGTTFTTTFSSNGNVGAHVSIAADEHLTLSTSQFNNSIIDFNADGTVARISGPNGENAELYSATGDYIGRRNSSTDAQGIVSTVTYGVDDQLESKDVTSRVGGVTTATHFDMASGMPVEVGYSTSNDSLGSSTTKNYEFINGAAVETSYEVSTLTAGVRTTTKFDLQADQTFQLTGTSRTEVDSYGRLISVNYDADGALDGYLITDINQYGDAETKTFLADGEAAETVELTHAGTVAFTANNGNAIKEVAWMDDGTSAQITKDGDGNNDLYETDANGKTSDTWSRADGSSGVTYFNDDGSEYGTVQNQDGSVTTMTADQLGNSASVTYLGSTIVGDSWTRPDGSQSVEEYNVDGGSSSRDINSAGVETDVTVDSLGNSDTHVYSKDGILISETVHVADGSSVSKTFDSAGATVSTTSVSPDGAYEITVVDQLGDSSSEFYNVSGFKTSATTNNIDGSHSSFTQDDQRNSLEVSYAPDGTYSKHTLSASGDASWEYYNAAGNFKSGSYSHVDGTYGDSESRPDGSVVTRNHNRDGSYNSVTLTASGDSLTVRYSANGTELSETSVVNGVAHTTSMGNQAAVSNFERDGVFAHAAKQDNDTVVGLYASTGPKLTEYINYSPDDNAGYGGDPSYHTYAVYQNTYFANGIIEEQTVVGGATGLGNASQLVREVSLNNESTVPLFGVVPDGIVASTTNTSTPAHVTASTLTITPLTGSKIGIGVPNGGGAPLYVYDNNAIAKYDLSGNLEPVAVAGVNISNIAAALNYVAALINADSESVVYTDGSTFSYTTGKPYGEIDNYVETDAAGNYIRYHLDDDTLAQTWVGRNAAGDTYSADDNGAVIRYANGQTAEVDIGSAFETTNSTFDTVYDRYGNTISTRVSGNFVEDISVDSLGDVIKSDFTNPAEYGNQAVSTSWTEADGTTVVVNLDLTTGAGTERINYTDGSYTLLLNDAAGNSDGYDYTSQGTAVGHEWAHADGSHGSNSNTADGNELDKWINADGSHGSQVTDAITGEVVGSSIGADGMLQSSWDTLGLANGQSETTSKEYGANGAVVTYHTITQVDGSFAQTWTSTDGSSGTNALVGSSGERTGTSSDGLGNTSSYDKTELSNGAVESVETHNYVDGSQMHVDTVTQASGSYTQTWSSSDGSTGTNVLDAATGETSGSKVVNGGWESDTWDNTTLSDGSQESKTSTLYADGSGISYDTVNHGNGSYEQSWSKPDGSHGTSSVDAATGETTGSIATAGSGVVISWDRHTLASGVTTQAAAYAYDDGSTTTVDSKTFVDGASIQAWHKSNGDSGSTIQGAQSGAGDTLSWDATTHYGTLQTFDGNDSLAVSQGVTSDQLWFNRDGDDLYLSVVGSDSYLDVEGWYSGTNAQLKSIELASGETLDRSDVQKLVDAMAAFAPPGSAQTQFTPQERTVLTPVLASTWH